MSDKKKKDQQGGSPGQPVKSSPLITFGMVHKLECAQKREISLPTPVDTNDSAKALEDIKYKWNEPNMMVVCDGGDLNSALYYLVNSLHDPFAKNAVATLLIQENQRDVFLARLIERLEPLDPKIYQHPNYLRSVGKLQKLQAETIVGDPKTVPSYATPVLVSDIFHSFLGDGPTGVITMHTFRTPKDATQVNSKEMLKYGSVSIWNEKLASSYELCTMFNNEIFMLNCFNVSLDPIQTQDKCPPNDVRIEKGYHYERLEIKNSRKIIVFPIGTIFAN